MAMTLRRKLAIATWSAPREGNIYGKLTIDATEALKYIEHQRKASGEKVTIGHLVGKAVALALKAAPSLNGRILWGRFIPHSTVDVTYLVVLEGGKNLAKAKIDQTDTKSCADIARELRTLAEKLRSGEDEQFKKSMGPVRFLPTWVLRPLLWFTGWLTSSLGLGAKLLGLERYPFGSAIVTNVGMFGLDEGFAPPTPFARVPVYVLLGAIRDDVVAIDGAPAVRKTLTLTATIDHRFIDGFQGGLLAKVVREKLSQPWELDGHEAPPEGYGDPAFAPAPA